MAEALLTLRRMAHRGTLEVEHLLRAAKHPAADLADSLDSLAEEMGWNSSDRGDLPTGTVPFGQWTQVVSAYCRGGFASLGGFRATDLHFSMVLALIEQLRTTDALSFALELGAGLLENPSEDPSRSLRLAATLNLLLSFKPRLSLSRESKAKVRDFLHKLALLNSADHARGTVYCALRYVGDAETLNLISNLPPLRDHWASAQDACKRAIAKRLKDARV